MFYQLKFYLRDWWINIALVLVVLIQFFIWWYLLTNIKSSAGTVFLHYNIVFGIDLVGQWYKMYYYPLFGLLVFLLNTGLSFLLYKTDRFLSRFLVGWSLLWHCFLLTAVVLLVKINL